MEESKFTDQELHHGVVFRTVAEPEANYSRYLRDNFGVQTYDEATRIAEAKAIDGDKFYEDIKRKLKGATTVAALIEVAKGVWERAQVDKTFSPDGSAYIKCNGYEEKDYWKLRNRVIRFTGRLFKGKRAYPSYKPPRKRHMQSVLLTTAPFRIPCKQSFVVNYDGNILKKITDILLQSPDFYRVQPNGKFWNKGDYFSVQLDYLAVFNCTVVSGIAYDAHGLNGEDFSGCVGRSVRFLDDNAVTKVSDYLTVKVGGKFKLVLTSEGHLKGFKLENGRECYVKNMGSTWNFCEPRS
jgi:hypothetical protein